MIIKVKNKPGFAQIQNKTLRDKRLSLETRGALGEILSYSEAFETSVPSLMNLLGISREKLLKITNELKENGYLQIIPVHDPKGKIIDKEWTFFGESQGISFRKQKEKEINHDTENPHDGGANHHAGFTNVGENLTMENPHHHILEISTSQEEELKEIEKSGGGTEKPSKPQTAAGSTSQNPTESRDEYLLRKQLEYPQFDVQEIFRDFVAKCRSPEYPKLKPNRAVFDKWLKNQHVPLETHDIPIGTTYVNPMTGKGLK